MTFTFVLPDGESRSFEAETGLEAMVLANKELTPPPRFYGWFWVGGNTYHGKTGVWD